MRRAAHVQVLGLASRGLDRARAAAAALDIPRAYGSYDDMLADPEIDAVYNPLPNHLHVPWTIRAAEAGKHVLCEKPIAMTASEAETLIAVRDRTGVLIQEAFMVRTNPQWIRTIDLVRTGRIGTVRAVVGIFSFTNNDPQNIRNIADYGGGALMDIGCYLVHTARWIFGREPGRVLAVMKRDEVSDVDRLTSITLDFGNGHAIGTCSTQQTPYQRIQILGTAGRIEVEIPFNAPIDAPSRIFVGDGSDPTGVAAETLTFPVCDQYTIEAERLSDAILSRGEQPLSLEDSVRNMRVMDAVVEAARSGQAVAL